MDRDALIADLQDMLQAAIDYIDAIPKETVAAFPAMPGFDRDYADWLLTIKD